MGSDMVTLPQDVLRIVVGLYHTLILPMFVAPRDMIHIVVGHSRFYWHRTTKHPAQLKPVIDETWPSASELGAIRGIVSGKYFTMIYTDIGRFMYGDNSHSALGLDVKDMNVPGAFVPRNLPIVGAACGRHFTLAICAKTADETCTEMYEWGQVGRAVNRCPGRMFIFNPVSVAARDTCALVAVYGCVYRLRPDAWRIDDKETLFLSGFPGVVRITATKKWWIIQTEREYVVLGDDWKNTPGALIVHSLPVDWERVLVRKLNGLAGPIIAVDAMGSKPAVLTTRGIYSFGKSNDPGVCAYRL